MATSFPTALDAFTNPVDGDTMDNPNHADQHSNANDAIKALEAKVGINGSGVTTSLDYRISQLESRVTNETPSGEVNGSNVTFTLANTPANGIELFVSGIAQKPGASYDYTLSGQTITFTYSPQENSELLVHYNI